MAESKGKKFSRLVGMFIGAAIGASLVSLAFFPGAIFPISNPSLPRKSADLVLLASIISIFYTITGYIKLKNRRTDNPEEDSEDRPRLRRPREPVGTNLLVWQVCLLMIAHISYLEGGWDLQSVGGSWNEQSLDGSWFGSSILAFVVGFTCYIAFGYGYASVLQYFGSLEKVRARNLATMASLWPRGNRQKCFATVAICVINPITEELLFRGILVHQFHQLLGSIYLPLTIGLLANVGNHLYQGATGLRTHIPFYFIAVALLYSPAGLVGCIGFHFAGDLYPVKEMKRNACFYKTYYRIQRKHSQKSDRTEEEPKTRI